jgi:hypothetical protein
MDNRTAYIWDEVVYLQFTVFCVDQIVLRYLDIEVYFPLKIANVFQISVVSGIQAELL